MILFLSCVLCLFVGLAVGFVVGVLAHAENVKEKDNP